MQQAATGRPVQEVLADAVRALTEGARVSGDWAEFVTHALAGAAANVGSIEGALQGRPGSWEADGVRNLLTSTVGHDEAYLLEHRTEPVHVTVYVDEILSDLGVADAYDKAFSALADRPAVTDEEVDALGELEGRLEDQRLSDYRAYGATVKTAVEEAAATRGLAVPLVVTVDVTSYRPYEEQSQPGDVEERLLGRARAATPLLAAWERPPLERLEATS